MYNPLCLITNWSLGQTDWVHSNALYLILLTWKAPVWNEGLDMRILTVWIYQFQGIGGNIAFHWEMRQDSRDSGDICRKMPEGYFWFLHLHADTHWCHSPLVSAMQKNSAFHRACVAQVSHNKDGSHVFHSTPQAQLYASCQSHLQ